ncbi:hypothetical protein [Planctomonas psychrotolerans]|uniref:hypothetical protein n=1 Tax=Planctomonas psychrotolerans TaxID=2528712 RepID=UPI00123B7BA7|nr:hypothetical protein [Planctomonas psychrotolerans]
MDTSEIRWNDEAREKILTDSDRVLQEAVHTANEELAGQPWEKSFARLIELLEGRFIDFEPGPDIRKYAEAIANSEV